MPVRNRVFSLVGRPQWLYGENPSVTPFSLKVQVAVPELLLILYQGKAHYCPGYKDDHLIKGELLFVCLFIEKQRLFIQSSLEMGAGPHCWHFGRV